MTMMKPMGVVAGVCGLGFIGYCFYFDHKRRSDPDFKKKLKQSNFILFNRLNSILVNNNDNGNLPDLKDQEAVQKFFMEQVALGEQLLEQGDHENCVKHLTNAMAVCGQPQQLLQVFQNMLPPPVFQKLLQNLAKLGSTQQKPSAAASSASAEADGLD
eukprot:gene2709-921_t